MPKYFRVRDFNVVLHRTLPSTNITARIMAENGEPEGTVIMASFQTDGIGRFDRKWICPPSAGLMISMILQPELNIKRISGLTLLCSVAVCDVVTDMVAGGVGVKWPNDVLINNKKVCGILAHSGKTPNNTRYVTMGVGININQTAEELPDDCKDTSTSLRIETGRRISRMEVLKSLLSYWDAHYISYLNNGYVYLHDVWKKRSITLGNFVTVSNNNNISITGVAKDISQDGGLIIELTDGSTRVFLSEEISLGKTFITDQQKHSF